MKYQINLYSADGTGKLVANDDNGMLQYDDVMEAITGARDIADSLIAHPDTETDTYEIDEDINLRMWTVTINGNKAHRLEIVPTVLDEVFTASEAATTWGLAESTVRQAINRKQMPARKSANVWLVAKSSMTRKWGDPPQKISIVFALDMLWQEVSADDYDADATEQAYEEAVGKALLTAGYETDITWSSINSMEIADSEGHDITDERYDEIRTVIDRVQFDYIEMPDVDDEYDE